MRFMGNGITSCYPDEVDNFISITVLSVRILSHGAGINGDWRTVPRKDVHYEDFTLDDDVAGRCRLLTRTLGLSFAAIDLIETHRGTYFIEINPTGEWGWLSSQERPIDKAIASWLNAPTRNECSNETLPSS